MIESMKQLEDMMAEITKTFTVLAGCPGMADCKVCKHQPRCCALMVSHAAILTHMREIGLT